MEAGPVPCLLAINKNKIRQTFRMRWLLIMQVISWAKVALCDILRVSPPFVEELGVLFLLKLI